MYSSIAQYRIRCWMEEKGFLMDFFTVEMIGRFQAEVIDQDGESMILEYSPVRKCVEEVRG